MKIRCRRWQMVTMAPAMAYDIMVPEAEVADWRRDMAGIRTIDEGGAVYYSYADATRPAAHRHMPPGWDRYDAWCAHDRAARQAMLEIGRQYWPELRHVTDWPTLWLWVPRRLPAEDFEISVVLAAGYDSPVRGGIHASDNG